MTDLTLPCLSPDARCSPSGLTRIERTPFFPSQVVSVLSVAPAGKKIDSFNHVVCHEICLGALTTTKTHAEQLWVNKTPILKVTPQSTHMH